MRADYRSRERETFQAMAEKTVREVLEKHTDEWLSISGVVGTAIGELGGQPCIKILAVSKTEELVRKIPPVVEGFPVVIEGVGEIRTR